MILVTGGTGFIGRRLVAQLRLEGKSVAVLTHDPKTTHCPGGVPLVLADLTTGLSPALLTGVQSVVHLAARGGDGELDTLRALNVRGTHHLASAAAEVGVERFVHISSAGVYGRFRPGRPLREEDPLQPETAYERSKAEAEHAVERACTAGQVPLAILRPAGVYGPGRPATEDFIRQVHRRRLWIHGPRPAIVHPTFVDDVVHAIQRLLERPVGGLEVYNIAGERALTFPEWIREVGRQAGHVPWQFQVPEAAALLLGRRGALRYYRELDTTRARERLSFEPVPMQAGIAMTLAGDAPMPNE